MKFATLPDGRDVERHTISNGDLSASFLTYGAILHEVRLAGLDYNLTLNSDNLEDYYVKMKYYGALIGPVGNRIKGARARLNGIEHMLTPNEGRNTLHSAEAGSFCKLWTLEELTDSSITLSVTLPDGDAGFPGNQRVLAHYSIEADNVLRLELTVTTDEDAWVNVVNHAYWNLSGEKDITNHKMQIAARQYLPVDDETLPTEPTDVEGTLFDFRELRPVVPGEPDLDHNFCLSRIKLDMREVMTLQGGDVTMKIATDAPGLQVYDGRDTDAQGFAPYAGLALEPQYWPNAPHEPTFPKIVLKAGGVWTQESEWRFSR
ncbi:galactose mutarotase [Marivivens donghaensis]|uniref:Galactose mutarotase n=1 Tax=Marivivens donghaensis TaxID=1699413 RepID=A0ABX0VTM9_9RHOB|nr:aldose epimerase family protein [Marivivens donghaensis]NIY70848.1 galactose mutarotase [Marivivens donghaensis]